VRPIYVKVGLAWESAERVAVEQCLRHVLPGYSTPLATLSVDMTDVYPASHWAMAGRPPEYHTPDEDVYLHGRNIVLLAKAGIYCAANGIGRLVMGTLDHNPFPDATPQFRHAVAKALTLGLAHPLAVDAPYSRLTKAEVIRRGIQLSVPLELTLSCMNPVRPDSHAVALHCGACSKCRERHDAFVEAGVVDPTEYASAAFVSPSPQQ
jgi:7-cyano-7-deazaguanine synthase